MYPEGQLSNVPQGQLSTLIPTLLLQTYLKLLPPRAVLLLKLTLLQRHHHMIIVGHILLRMRILFHKHKCNLTKLP